MTKAMVFSRPLHLVLVLSFVAARGMVHETSPHASKSKAVGFLHTHGRFGRESTRVRRTQPVVETPTPEQSLSLQLISKQQEDLIARLNAVKSALGNISARAKVALVTATDASQAVEQLSVDVSAYNVKTIANNQSRYNVEAGQVAMNATLANWSAGFDDVQEKVNFVQAGGRLNAEHLGLSYVKWSPEKMKTNADDLERMVTEDNRTMQLALPRLVELEKRITMVEGRLHGGNLTKLIDVSVHHEMRNTLEDIGRAGVVELDKLASFKEA